MEIRQLKYFVTIADSGSFSEASRRCFLSQSAISQQIKVLEEELNTSLFVRTPHKVTLTESGEILLPIAQRVLDSVEDCKERMADVNNIMCGELTIGLNTSLEPYVRKAVARFMKIHPKVHLNLRYLTIPDMIRLLRGGELDMAFSIHVDGEEDWVVGEPIIKLRMCAIMRDTHPLACKQEISFTDLKNQSMILPEKGSSSMNAIERYLVKSRVNLQVKATINDPCAILNMLKISNCICILSEHCVDGIDELRAVPIKELSEPLITYVYMLKNVYQKRSATAFINILKEQIKLQDSLPVFL